MCECEDMDWHCLIFRKHLIPFQNAQTEDQPTILAQPYNTTPHTCKNTSFPYSIQNHSHTQTTALKHMYMHMHTHKPYKAFAASSSATLNAPTNAPSCNLSEHLAASRYSISARASSKYTVTCGGNSSSFIVSYTRDTMSARAYPRSTVVFRRFSSVDVKSSLSIARIISSISCGCGVPVVEWIVASVIPVGCAAWLLCRMLRQRRMSPCESFKRAVLPSGEIWMLGLRLVCGLSSSSRKVGSSGFGAIQRIIPVVQ